MEKVINTKEERIFLDSLKDIVKSARKFAYNSINLAQLRQNWLIGQNLVIQEQKGKSRAEYGKHIIEIASKELTEEYGKGFSERSLWKFKQFYLTFNDLQILPTVSAESLGRSRRGPGRTPRCGGVGRCASTAASSRR